MFEKPEREKMDICERYRELGNLLFTEGLDYLPRAAHYYQLVWVECFSFPVSMFWCEILLLLQALSYYEYCFPETDEEQQHINLVKYACQCNISLCYYRMGYYREAINAATLAINDKEVDVGAKAYFRRAAAYRKLGEYRLTAQRCKYNQP